MQLRTPKRYTVKGSRRPLINLKWLWLYLITPLIVIIAVLIWDYRQSFQDVIGQQVSKINIQMPTTPTVAPTPPDPGDVTTALKTGHVNRAVDILSNWSDSTPNLAKIPSLAAQLLVLRADSANKANQDRATKLAQKAIAAEPETADGWITQALVLDWQQQPKAALGYALRAKDLNPKDPMVMTVLGEIYHDLQKDDDATKLIDSAIAAAKAANPVDTAALTHAYYVKALIYDAANDNKSAVAQMQEAWKFAQSDMTIPSSYISQWLGAYYLTQNLPTQSVDVLSDGIKRDQDDPILQWQLGIVYINTGDANKARTYFETCRNLDPLERLCLKRLAQLYYAEQNFQLALETIQKVIDQKSTDPKDYYMMGIAYQGLNQCANAIGALTQGMQYIEADDASRRADFEQVLNDCGAPVGVPTAAATEDTTVRPTTPPTSK